MTNDNSTSAPDIRVLTQQEIVEMFGVHKTTIMRWVSTGSFPEPLFHGDASVSRLVWSHRAVAEWMESGTGIRRAQSA